MAILSRETRSWKTENWRRSLISTVAVRSLSRTILTASEDRRARLGHDADTPHRIKYKPLVRA